MTMETEGSYSERIFEAPNNEVAIKFASEFPTTNGWSPGTHWRVGKYHPLEINLDGLVVSYGCFYEYHEGFTEKGTANESL